MHIRNMSKEDFSNVPYITKKEKIEFSSLVIIPTGELHESGFGCMSFVLARRDGEPIGKICGGCDVVYLDGIGGAGFHPMREPISFKEWRFDCLPCGYLNLWTRKKLFVIGEDTDGSVLEVFSEDRYED